MNYNRVILMGNLTRNPILSFLPSKTPIVEFGMAVNRKWKGKDGNEKDETCFVECKMFGKRAEVINQYLDKGNPLLVEGRLVFDQWTAKDDTKRNKLSVLVENFEFIAGQQQQPKEADF